ncbi:hypothetical protein CGK40_24435 [Vibrio parahaemolyticus]|uniref:hypothetical protein n=1 Tax=Vibrio parahaemolyticus TaxID=670 RepID=UPI00111DDA75|nr:hypothetical protein [Vibrio parahaemolyticus]TNZ86747.1 hypothetical protein CGK40_24435 [Vibrio parahaemolyticus]
MLTRTYLRAFTTDQDADRAKNELQTFAHEHNVRIASFYTEQVGYLNFIPLLCDWSRFEGV